MPGSKENAAVGNLRKYNSTPPVWFMDVNSEPVELDTDGLMNQTLFQKACMEQINFMPRSVAKAQWEARISAMMREMTENQSAIIEVSVDASVGGQFYDFLEEFCSHMQQAKDREEILLRRPWTDEEGGLHIFQAQGLRRVFKEEQVL